MPVGFVARISYQYHYHYATVVSNLFPPAYLLFHLTSKMTLQEALLCCRPTQVSPWRPVRGPATDDSRETAANVCD